MAAAQLRRTCTQTRRSLGEGGPCCASLRMGEESESRFDFSSPIAKQWREVPSAERARRRGRTFAWVGPLLPCGRTSGCSSEVERQLPKLNVEGSIPFARSSPHTACSRSSFTVYVPTAFFGLAAPVRGARIGRTNYPCTEIWRLNFRSEGQYPDVHGRAGVMVSGAQYRKAIRPWVWQNCRRTGQTPRSRP